MNIMKLADIEQQLLGKVVRVEIESSEDGEIKRQFSNECVVESVDRVPGTDSFFLNKHEIHITRSELERLLRDSEVNFVSKHKIECISKRKLTLTSKQTSL